MKNYHFIILGLCLSLSSCVLQATYFGDTLASTNSINVYYSAHDVKKEYKVIGHLTCPNIGSQDEVKATLIARAKKAGADAIVIVGTDATKDNPAAVVNADALKYN